MPQTLEADTTEVAPGLWEVLSRVDRLAADSLEPDEASDSPVAPETADKAKTVIIQTVSKAVENDVKWIRPSITTTPDGEILISWRQVGRSLSLTIGNQPTVIVVSKEPDLKPERRVKGLRTAIEDVISSFRRMAIA